MTETDTTMRRGRIKMLSYNRGFGFVEPDDASEDVFIHVSRCGGQFAALEVGDVVSYTVRPSKTKAGGLDAHNVRRVRELAA
jgi:cold shock CspA family protein